MSERLAHLHTRLPNGLKVVVHRDARLPMIAFSLGFACGSKDDPTDRSGLAHLSEHLFFCGTPGVPEGVLDSLLESRGASSNAATGQDRTLYDMQGPGHELELMLWLESDRLGNLGPALTQDALDRQREVVRNERRQTYENRPYGRVWLELPRLLYPPGHPYRQPIIGSHEDLLATTVEDVQGFLRTHYAPDEACLVLAGDLDPERALDQVERRLGDWPARGTAPRRVEIPPERAGRPAVLALHEDVPAALSVFAWRTPAWYADPDDAALDVAAAVLAEGASSRLQKRLLRELELAQSVGAGQSSGQLDSSFLCSATALSDIDPERLEEVVEVEIGRLAQDGPTSEELERVVGAGEAALLKSLQGLPERAEVMNEALARWGDPEVVEREIARYRALDEAAVARATRKHLLAGRRVHLRVLPRPAPRLHSGPPLTPPPAPAPRKWEPPVPGDSPPAPVWSLRRDSPPLVGLRLAFEGGARTDPRGAEGLCSLLFAVMGERAGGRDAADLAAALEGLGADLTLAAERASCQLGLVVPRANLEPALDLCADLLLRPAVTSEDFKRVRRIRLAHARQRAREPQAVATLVTNRYLHAAQPELSHPILGYTRSLEAIEHRDLAAAHERWERARRRRCAVAAGGPAAEELEEILSARLGPPAPDWPPSPPVRTPLQPKGQLLLVANPEVNQTSLRVALPAPALPDPEVAAWWLVNAALGGTFGSRLNQRLREEMGLSYGVSSALHLGPSEGVWMLQGDVEAERTEEAVAEVRTILEDTRTRPFTEEELSRALESERLETLRVFEDVATITAVLLPLQLAGAAPDLLRATWRRLGEISPEEAQRVCADAFRPDKATWVLVGPPARIEAAGRELGLVTLETDEEGFPRAGTQGEAREG